MSNQQPNYKTYTVRCLIAEEYKEFDIVACDVESATADIQNAYSIEPVILQVVHH